MDSKVNFDNMPKYVILETEGEASPMGFDSVISKLVESPEWITGTHLITDHRNLITHHLSAITMNNIKEMVSKHSMKLGGGRVALVVGSELGYAFARMYEILEGNELHSALKVCRSVEEAIEWVDE